jgi:hypothetical protein
LQGFLKDYKNEYIVDPALGYWYYVTRPINDALPIQSNGGKQEYHILGFRWLPNN